jgi:hypothetical protein
MRKLGAGSAAGAVLIAAVVASSASGSVPRQAPPIPPIPTPPNLPKPPKIPGEKIVKFKLVFDGTSHADRVIDIGGQTGGCDVQAHEDISEDVTFGRGKGITMEFVRFKQHGKVEYGFQRSGRNLDSSFNVVAKIERTASGAGDLIQHPNSVTCQAQHVDFSQNPDCGKPKTDNSPWGLKVQSDHFYPTSRAADNLAGPTHCGEGPSGSAFAGTDIAELEFQWPVPPKFPFEPIPLRKMFNTRYHAFKVEFKSLDAQQNGHSGIGLTENWHDHGNAEATVRFIRQ